ncbi:mitochondrial mRNA pseudouridine synthase Trub2 [Orussus abietinus]|uniref:mitochondrial mRNA pseudouridine synthase Trub2 n=1 Tax=Orussus abietinus TaxID=222816 RepID=UPI000626C208|nr:mitochondrial mRNA pseudouridine synthase Trub2 [Orussus abietinus]
MRVNIFDARLAWQLLNGVFAVYKPPGVHVKKVRQTLMAHLCRDLNSMKVRPPINHVYIEGETNKPMTVSVGPSYADHILVVGPRYQHEDLKLTSSNYLGSDASGILLCGVNSGNRIVHKIRESRPTSFYKIKGTLGQATDTFFITGKIIEKSSYKHVKRIMIDRICASMQSSHQKKMFELCGVDMQSQAAYELATKGPIRPADNNIPMIYAIKCIDFNSPEFTLEVVSINESLQYLQSLIHEIGIELHTTATCTQVQCFKYGLFDIQLALLKKYWNLENILENMKLCKNFINKNKFIMRQENPSLVKPNLQVDGVVQYTKQVPKQVDHKVE